MTARCTHEPLLCLSLPVISSTRTLYYRYPRTRILSFSLARALSLSLFQTNILTTHDTHRETKL